MSDQFSSDPSYWTARRCHYPAKAILGGIFAFSVYAAGASADPLEIRRHEILPTSMTEAATGPHALDAAVRQKGFVWRQLVRHPTATSGIRVHVTIGTDADPEGWVVRVAPSGAGEHGLEITASEEALGRGWWSQTVAAQGAFVEIEALSDASLPSVEVNRYAYVSRRAVAQSFFGRDQRVYIRFSDAPWPEVGKSVARLRFMADGIGEAFCTGFLIADRLLMTSHHCISTNGEAASAFADFLFDGGSSTTSSVAIRAIAAKNEELDYSVVELVGAPPVASVPLRLRTQRSLSHDQALALVQHPGGDEKQLSLEDCRVSTKEEQGVGGQSSDFGHTCDTLGGSSGAPVLDESSAQVVGLHHMGFHSGSQELVNQAVYIIEVVAHLESEFPAIHSQLNISAVD